MPIPSIRTIDANVTVTKSNFNIRPGRICARKLRLVSAFMIWPHLIEVAA
jgi:hypothetical protein